MKKLLFLIFFISHGTIFNKDILKAKKYLQELKKINAAANELFSQILALQLCKQVSFDEGNVNQDLLLTSSELRKQIEKLYLDFSNDVKIQSIQ